MQESDNMRMETYDALHGYYAAYKEEERLLSRHGQVEYRTTMAYIHRYLRPGDRIAELGAGTGRYSLALAAEGYEVTAVDLIPENIDRLREQIAPEMRIETYVANAAELPFLADGSFDMVLNLGPMYHMFTEEERSCAISETFRLVRPGGVAGFAYCMMDPTAVQFLFGGRDGTVRAREYIDRGLVDLKNGDFRLVSTPAELFQLYRVSDINRLMESAPGRRLHMVGTDMATNYIRPVIDAMDDETFSLWLRYHFSICEDPSLLGASHHILDLWQR